jgi:hypothetical protein
MAPAPNPQEVVAAIDRLGQKTDETNKLLSDLKPVPAPVAAFENPTLGSPGVMDVNTPLDPEDR